MFLFLLTKCTYCKLLWFKCLLNAPNVNVNVNHWFRTDDADWLKLVCGDVTDDIPCLNQSDFAVAQSLLAGNIAFSRYYCVFFFYGFPHPSFVSSVSNGGGRALHETLVHFELPGFGRSGNTVFQRDQDGLALCAVKPIIGLHRRLWTNRVGVQVFLEEVRLKERDIFSLHGRQTEHMVKVSLSW